MNIIKIIETNFIEITNTNTVTNILNQIDIIDIPTSGWDIFIDIITAISTIAMIYSIRKMAEQNQLSAESVQEMKKQATIDICIRLKQEYDNKSKDRSKGKIKKDYRFENISNELQKLDELCFLIQQKDIEINIAKYFFRESVVTESDKWFNVLDENQRTQFSLIFPYLFTYYKQWKPEEDNRRKQYNEISK